MTEPPDWQTLGAIPSSRLADARLQLHHAAQLAAAAGRSLLPARPDDSQTAFEWLPAEGLLAGAWIEGAEKWRVALHPAGCALRILGASGAAAEFPLSGRTLDEGFSWLRDQAAARGSDAARLSRAAPYELPARPAGAGAPLRPDLAACAELARYWADGALLFRGRAAPDDIRCWPHHFDLGYLMNLGPNQDGKARSVGVGLSPGDDSYAEPYLYVTLWPIPKTSFYPPLPGGGNWHRKAWVGAVLTGFALTAQGPQGQSERAAAFLDAALASARRLLVS
jgi:hypothetical protein